MKTLRESLFDGDLKSKDIMMGEIYEIHPDGWRTHYDNDLDKLMDCFSPKIHNIKLQFVKDSNLNLPAFALQKGVLQLMELILQIPAQIFEQPSINEMGMDIKKVLKPYIDPDCYKDMIISVKLYLKQGWVVVSIYDNLKSSTPNSLVITFKKK